MDVLIQQRCRVNALGVAAILLASTVAGCPVLRGQAANEYEVKAAFLYKFASFVEWPPGERSSVCIGVVGEDPFGVLLDQVVKGKSINGRMFRIRRFGPNEKPDNCDILFISPSEHKRLRAILEELQGASVLTVGETSEFCRNGGVIGFEILDDRVRFEINLEAAARARLKVSSKLISVARITRNGAGR